MKHSNFIGPDGPMYPQEIRVGQRVLFLSLPWRVLYMTLLSREMVDGIEESRFDVELAHECLT